eukprot:1371993-Pyramimonas_sp.AAC.1
MKAKQKNRNHLELRREKTKRGTEEEETGGATDLLFPRVCTASPAQENHGHCGRPRRGRRRASSPGPCWR